MPVTGELSALIRVGCMAGKKNLFLKYAYFSPRGVNPDC
jgi:hypothetical protein